MRTFVNDLDFETPDTINDIQCGKVMDGISQLSQLTRMIWEDADSRSSIQEIEGIPQIVTLSRKREEESEVNAKDNSVEVYWIYTKHGRRVPLTEEEYTKLLKIKETAKNDVYSQDELLLSSLDSAYIPQKDRWDLLKDVTDYVNQVRRINDLGWLSSSEKAEQIKELEPYYNSYYLTPPRKVVTVPIRVKQFVERIRRGEITSRREVSNFINRFHKNCAVHRYQEMKAEVSRMPNGKLKVIKAKAAQNVLQNLVQKKIDPIMPLNTYEKHFIWSEYSKYEFNKTGKTRMSPQTATSYFTKKFSSLIEQGEITSQQASVMVQDKVKELFAINKVFVDQDQLDIKDDLFGIEEWLEKHGNEIDTSHSQADYDFDAGQADWLEKFSQQQDEYFQQEGIFEEEQFSFQEE